MTRFSRIIITRRLIEIMRTISIIVGVATILQSLLLVEIEGFVFIDWKLFQLPSIRSTAFKVPRDEDSGCNDTTNANSTGSRSHRQVSNVTTNGGFNLKLDLIDFEVMFFLP